MAAIDLTQLDKPQRLTLTDVLHKAPGLYELLPQCSRQRLSATCSCLHKWVRERTTCVRIRYSDELSGLTPETWPNLIGVLLPKTDRDVLTLVQGKWHMHIQIHFWRGSYAGGRQYMQEDDQEYLDWFPQHGLLLLISPLSNAVQADSDLTPQQCEVVCQIMDMAKAKTAAVIVGCQQQSPRWCETQTACSAHWLPGNLWDSFGNQAWPIMRTLEIHNQQCSVSCAQGLVTRNFETLENFVWCGGTLTAPVCAVLSQACLPLLASLSLDKQGLDAAGLAELLQASWPCLTHLSLADNKLEALAMTALSTSSWCKTLTVLMLGGNALGQEGVRALGLGQWEALETCSLVDCSIGSRAAVTSLAQLEFPKLEWLLLTGRFETGAITCLSDARWPTLRYLVLSFAELTTYDCDILGIDRRDVMWTDSLTAAGRNWLHAERRTPSLVLPSVRRITVEH